MLTAIKWPRLLLIDVDWCWLQSNGIDCNQLMPAAMSLCWLVLIAVDWYWQMLTTIKWHWLQWTDANCGEHTLTYVDCRLVLTAAAWFGLVKCGLGLVWTVVNCGLVWTVVNCGLVNCREMMLSGGTDCSERCGCVERLLSAQHCGSGLSCNWIREDYGTQHGVLRQQWKCIISSLCWGSMFSPGYVNNSEVSSCEDSA